MKSSCLMQSVNISVQINCSHLINQVFDQATRQSINSSLSRIKFILPLRNFLRERDKDGVFRSIQTFDKVWHDGLLSKLKNYGISGSLFTVINPIVNNELFLTEKAIAGPLSLQVCLKAPSLLPYVS